jgi:hypothetical protein
MNTRKRSSRRAPRRKARGGASPLKRPAAILPPAPDDPPFLEFWKRANGTLPQKVKEADLRTLNSGLGFLFGRLRQARAQFEQEEDHARDAAYTTLGAFHRFITLFRKPLDEALHVPIVRLQDALLGLDQGRIDAILRPNRRSGRAPSSQTYAGLRGHAVATVQLLILHAGLARDNAHRAVATKLRLLGVRPGRGSGPVTTTTVRNWCDEAASDVGRHDMVAMMYDHKLARGKEMLSGLSKSQARQSALKELAYWVGTIFPELQKPT